MGAETSSSDYSDEIDEDDVGPAMTAAEAQAMITGYAQNAEPEDVAAVTAHLHTAAQPDIYGSGLPSSPARCAATLGPHRHPSGTPPTSALSPRPSGLALPLSTPFAGKGKGELLDDEEGSSGAGVGGDLSEGLLMCEECVYLAILHCAECNKAFCSACFAALHDRSGLQHTTTVFTEEVARGQGIYPSVDIGLTKPGGTGVGAHLTSSPRTGLNSDGSNRYIINDDL